MLPVLTGIALLAAFGVIEGLWTNRWSPSQEAGQADAQLARVPKIVGEWVGRDQELDPRMVARAEMAGYLLRQYVHRKTGQAITMVLVCGRPGPTAVHTPDICFKGAGYGLAAPPHRYTVSAGEAGPSANLWVARFDKNDAIPAPVRVYWAWSATGAWEAPDYPRLHFSGHAALYKLYVVRQLPKVDERLADDPSKDFLGVFLPEAGKCLFPASAERNKA
jgi:hypothetical protein